MVVVLTAKLLLQLLRSVGWSHVRSELEKCTDVDVIAHYGQS